ncbi:MAG: hypothetical protein A2087_04870 [Spirochaetes bacterium GWD1_61_31]|nr:MAG: hypothetical protein A2Y37_01590 [Spirochaetes bacterium GWB1_60_80]OHD34908.1 MAG: hypothetical protein A2004_00620 [Spirochaetes bacterium GWC1_61_12]OHD37063.1 MAG: hypothetical protein A2087_04870 [Spirochaetes bacterium GWD1_61_31]OHD45327.1 MAG: hypothetical protein A2Y35_00520 [Spirochaetes bacterium GWE1_60_18]OHD61079.1 MAG: hypothetical protein A2Y32_09205 [Spirochaetes bacterium GWF1_60_12]HAP42739.1 hypothetical protein [Spirochaetaceae bacterium]
MRRLPSRLTAASLLLGLGLSLLLGLGLGLLACNGCAGQRPVAATGDAAATDGPVVWLQGIIRLVGSEPHAEAVLTVAPAAGDPAGVSLDYYLTGPLSQEAQWLANQSVAVYGRTRQLELRLAGSSGRTRLRHELYAEIIRPQP